VTLTFERVADAQAAKRWHALEAHVVPLDHPGMVADPLAEVEHMAFGPRGDEHVQLYLGTEEGTDVATASIWLPMRDNLENATIFLAVHEAHRRRGIGTRFAHDLFARARAEGRRRAIAFVASPLDDDGAGPPFAASLRGEPALAVFRRQLDLTSLDTATLDALVAEHVGGHAAGYEAVSWVDRVPDGLLDGAAALMARMSTDPPLGSLEWEPEVWDGARYRTREDDAIARGRRRYATGAVETATGRLVAYTDIGVSWAQPVVGYQWDTVVDPDHRGHRLGMLVKVANLRRFRTAEPASERLQTWNAASNAHMVAINDLLGFVAVERSTTWQFDL
jgi:GNAT superfamily N-acetyltransferase